MSVAPPTIDLNGDVGEWDSTASDAAARLQADIDLAVSLSSLNVACGGHAGDPGSMRALVTLAKERGLALGAHPSFPDRSGFGRRTMTLAPAEIERLVSEQVGALVRIAGEEGIDVGHVKPHGALYNLAATDTTVADRIARGVARVNPRLVLVALSGSAAIDAGARAGLATASEVFADRTYESNGTLTPRTVAGSLLSDPDAAAARLVRMIREGVVSSRQGTLVPVTAMTACIHGDTPESVDFARRLRAALCAAGIDIARRGVAPLA
jgi:UPF0271 protein